jgi:salicylate hydroxylase
MAASLAPPKSIAIIGAGIGGLTAALALLQRGLEVDVYEQSTELTEVGAGIQISSNGTRVLDALGLQEALARVEVISSRREIRHWKTGETLDWFELGESEAQYYGTRHMMLHRGDLHSVLADAVRGLKMNAVKLGKRCIGVIQYGEHAEVRFDAGGTAGAAYVIGADGIHSKIRECLFGADKPEFTGCKTWRGLVPMERLPSHILRSVGTNWLGPNGHALHYPVRRGELMNFVSTIERDDWCVESWKAEGTIEELANDFRGWHADVHAIIRNIDKPLKWALMVRRPIDRWSNGRVTLLGDACHPTLPFLGQGAVMAIEDGYVLAACLEKYFTNPTKGFARYEEIRRERTAAVVRKSQEIRQQAFSPALANANGAAASVEREWRLERVEEQLDWLYTYDATAAQI